MNFTNSPYERIMKEIPHYEKSAPRKAREDRLVRGVLIGRVSPVFSAIESTSKSRANNVSIWPRLELDLQGVLSTVLAGAI